MAIVKALKGGRTLSGALSYAEHDKATDEKNLTRGVNCPDDKEGALEQMQLTKQLWDKEDGRQYKGYVISFPKDEVTPDQALDHSEKFLEKTFPGHEAFLGCHTDTENIHIHIIINSVNFEDGHKIHIPKSDLERYRDISDGICRDMGLSTIERNQGLSQGEIRTASRQEYEVLAQGITKGDKTSYKLNMYQDIKASLEKVEGKGFKALRDDLREKGIDVKMVGDKNITFSLMDDNEGKFKPIRGSNLEKTFSDPSMSRQSIEKTLSMERPQPQITKAPVQAIEVPKMTSVKDIEKQTAQVGSDARKMGQTIKGATEGKVQAPSQAPSRGGGGGGAGGGSGKPDIDDLIAQGMSMEQAEKVLADMENQVSIKLGGIYTGSIAEDLGISKPSRGMSR